MERKFICDPQTSILLLDTSTEALGNIFQSAGLVGLRPLSYQSLDLLPSFRGAGGFQSHHCVGSRKGGVREGGTEHGSFGTLGTFITEW